MRTLANVLLAVVTGASVGLPAPILTAQSEQALSITESDDGYRLQLPVSRLVMTIPKGSLAEGNQPRRGSATSPRYFLLQDRARGLAVSGWFEPAERYVGLEEFWKQETAAWSRNDQPPQDVSMTKVGGWDAIVYDVDIPRVTNTHIRAEWVEAGTWIDLHISVTTEDPVDKARATAMEFLRTIDVAMKE